MSVMQLKLKIVLGLLVAAVAASCSSSAPVKDPVVTEKELELSVDSNATVLSQDDGISLLRIEVEGFEALPLQDKIFAYYLYKATVAGRDITFDQHHRLSLKIRQLVDTIYPWLRISKDSEIAFTRFARMFWLNNGPYHVRNKTRIEPGFSRADLLDMLSNAGAEGASVAGMGGLLADVDSFLFNPKAEPLLVEKNPEATGDLLLDSAVNFYSNVSMSDLQGFTEQFPGTSTLIRSGGALREDPWRAGRKDFKGQYSIPAGKYAPELEQVNLWLEKAAQIAPNGAQRDYLRALIAGFESGDQKDFDAASKLWVDLDSDVDLIIGFGDTRLDPRGLKGEYGAMLMVKDRTVSSLMSEIAYLAPELELSSPWDGKYLKTWTSPPLANAMRVVAAVGWGGPMAPLGINLPASTSIRERQGSKSILLTNALAAVEKTSAEALLREFVPSDELESALKYNLEVSVVTTALHQIVGHGSGKVSGSLVKGPEYALGEYYDVIEEARAELVALYHIFDKRMLERGIMSSRKVAEEALKGLIRNDLMQLRGVARGTRTLADDRMKAVHLIASYLKKNCEECVKYKKKDGKTFVMLEDVAQAHKVAGALLGELMRIKAEGDRQAAKTMVDTWGLTVDENLQTEVADRAAKLGLPAFFAFHTPVMRMLPDDQGRPLDVMMDNGVDFETTMISWDRKDAEVLR